MSTSRKRTLAIAFYWVFLSSLILSWPLHAEALKPAKPTSKPVNYHAPFTATPPAIDGLMETDVWSKAKWRDVPYLITGHAPTNEHDLSMRYKVVWTKERLYLLAEIHDDILMDSHPNPLDHYWADDALEIFVDEDNSGGNHLHSYNAFAYHVALDNQAVDMGPFLSTADKKAGKNNIRTYPEHIRAAWKRSETTPYRLYWEASIALYPDTYKDSYSNNEEVVKSVKLKSGKQIGFMMSYCDSDSNKGREHFIGDVDIPAVNGDKNRGYIDASVFGVLELVK